MASVTSVVDLSPVKTDTETLLSRLTSGRAADMDNLPNLDAAISVLTGRLTSARAADMDNLPNLDAAISVLTGRLTGTRAGYLDNLPNLDATVSSRLNAAVKSTQRGTFRTAASALDVSISAVNTSKALVLLHGIGYQRSGRIYDAGSSYDSSLQFIRARLTSGTNLRIEMDNADANNLYGGWQVVEFY